MKNRSDRIEGRFMKADNLTPLGRDADAGRVVLDDLHLRCDAAGQCSVWAGGGPVTRPLAEADAVQVVLGLCGLEADPQTIALITEGCRPIP
jgi:hypothetical protein